MTRSISLNPGQLEILAWVRDGAPEDAYDDFRPRIIARALHNRGLVAVTGHGKSWSVTLTDDGAYYLGHGEYPAQPDQPARAEPASISKPAAERKPKSALKPRAPKPPRVGPTDAMLAALHAAPGNEIAIDYDEHRRYEQLAKTAERFKKVPDGMQVTVHSDWRAKTATVKLHPLPEWRTRVLDQIAVPGSLRGASDVVKKLRSREDFDISGTAMNRALRLVQALATEAEARGHKAKFIGPPPKDRWGYVQKHDRNNGHLMLVLGPDEYRLSFIQIMDRKEHVPSKSELARSGRGYAVPQWDHLPTERLIIRIETRGFSFWGSEWKDLAERGLEESLAQVLQEPELRHESEDRRRDAEELARIKRERQWKIAREKAVLALADSHRAEVLSKQTKTWKRAAEIREYADAVEQRALVDHDGDDRAAALEWAAWARDYAERTDPLLGPLSLPEAPQPTESALQPFMGKWSAYGPETTYRG